jgi:hypothetical protein
MDIKEKARLGVTAWGWWMPLGEDVLLLKLNKAGKLFFFFALGPKLGDGIRVLPPLLLSGDSVDLLSPSDSLSGDRGPGSVKGK